MERVRLAVGLAMQYLVTEGIHVGIERRGCPGRKSRDSVDMSLQQLEELVTLLNLRVWAWKLVELRSLVSMPQVWVEVQYYLSEGLNQVWQLAQVERYWSQYSFHTIGPTF